MLSHLSVIIVFLTKAGKRRRVHALSRDRLDTLKRVDGIIILRDMFVRFCIVREFAITVNVNSVLDCRSIIYAK